MPPTQALVITHGHEDHIGALPWVLPALDPSTPVYAGSFVMQLVARRMQEFNLYTPERCGRAARRWQQAAGRPPRPPRHACTL